MIEWVLDTRYSHLFHREQLARRRFVVHGLAEATLTPLMEAVERELPDARVFSLRTLTRAPHRILHSSSARRARPRAVQEALQRLRAERRGWAVGSAERRGGAQPISIIRRYSVASKKLSMATIRPLAILNQLTTGTCNQLADADPVVDDRADLVAVDEGAAALEPSSTGPIRDPRQVYAGRRYPRPFDRVWWLWWENVPSSADPQASKSRAAKAKVGIHHLWRA